MIRDLESQESKEHDFGAELHQLQKQLVREKSLHAGLKYVDEETVKRLGRFASEPPFFFLGSRPQGSKEWPS